jgi:serine/threonine-protein kinase
VPTVAPAVTPSAPAALPNAPTPAVAAPVVPAAPAAPDPAGIADVVRSYARAIASRDIGAVRQAYPGLTAEQERNFGQFFDATRSLRVDFSVADVEASGSTAEAQLAGTYDFVTTGGKSQKQPVSFHASLRHDGTRWRLTSVR